MNFTFKQWVLTFMTQSLIRELKNLIFCQMVMCHKRITFTLKVSLGPKIEKSLKYSFGNDVYQYNSSLLILSFAISALMDKHSNIYNKSYESHTF